MYMTPLNNQTANLLLGLDIDVSPAPDSGKSHNGEAGCSNAHLLLGNTVSSIDSVSALTANRVCELDSGTGVDGEVLALEVLGEVLQKSSREVVLPEGTTNRVTNGTTDGRRQAENGKQDSSSTVRTSCQSGNLVARNKNTTCKGNEDLAHDNVSNGGVGRSEVDHECGTENVDWDSNESDPLVATRVTDRDTGDNTEDAGADGVDVAHVGCFGDGKVVDNQVERVKVEIPAVEGDVESTNGEACTENGSILEESPGQELLGREVLLKEGEEDDQAESDDQECNDIVSAPSMRSSGCQAERQEEHDETTHEDEQSNDVELPEVESHCLKEGTVVVSWFLVYTHLHSLALVHEEDDADWDRNHGEDDGKDTVTPAPACVVDDGRCKEW